jgi:NADPH2:quinone reductase
MTAAASMRAVRVSATGDADVLRLESVPVPEPGRGEALVRVAYAGVNFIDVYHRRGLYPIQLPFTPGTEGAGVVESVGEDVREVQPGSRVGWVLHLGAYAELAVVPAARLVPVPPELDLRTAAAVMLQGMTAHYLARSTFPLRPGHAALIHAAAGGVGLLLVQVAKACGARVFGTVSTDEKAQLAREAGADELILYTREDFAAAARQYTEGRGVDVVYDSVGRSTFEGSLASLRLRGMCALFGQSSGPVGPFDPAILAKGSLFLTRPALAHYTAAREELLARAREVFEWVRAGALRVRIDRELPLAEAAEAHRLLESRATAGKLLLAVDTKVT